MLYLHGMGHFHPENVLDNAFFESLDIGTDDRWILERVGIRTRRTVLPLDYLKRTRNAEPAEANKVALYTNAAVGAGAARLALERAGLQASQIGMVISGSCTPQHSTPAEASTVAEALGIEGVCFDVNSACSSFGLQLHLLASMAPTLPEYALLVLPETNTRVIDYRERTGSILWGDGAAAAIVSARHPSRWRIAHSLIGTDAANWRKVQVPPNGHFHQEGKIVHAFAIKRTVAVVQQLKAHARAPENVYFVGHQANLRMLQGAAEKAGIQPERHLFNIHDFGNCGAAGAPSVLSQRWGKFEKGDEVAVAVVGAGLTWAGVLLQHD